MPLTRFSKSPLNEAEATDWKNKINQMFKFTMRIKIAKIQSLSFSLLDKFTITSVYYHMDML